MMQRPLLRTFALYRSQLWLAVLVLSLALLVNGGMAVTQVLFGLALDDLDAGELVHLHDGELVGGSLWFWGSVLLSVAAVRGALGFAHQVLSIRLGQHLLFELRSRVMDQVLGLDQSYHRAHGTGEIVTRATRDSDKVRDAVVIGARQLVDTSVVVLAALGVLAAFDPLLALLPGLLIAGAVWMLMRQTDRMVQLTRSADDAYERVTQDLTESVVGVRVVKSFSLETRRAAQFGGLLERFMGDARGAIRFMAIHLPLPQIVAAFGHGWVLWYGSEMVADGVIERGTLIALLMLMTGVVFRLDGIGRAMRVFADARASAARLWELLDARSDLPDGTRSPPSGALGLKFERVLINGEDPGNVVLRDCSLNVRPGEVLALVGATGSGKSTLCSLAPRLRDPDAGRVLVGNDAGAYWDLRECRIAELRRRVQVLFQDSFLFSDSIRRNLQLNAPEADDEALRRALAAAAADDFVRGMPAGLDTRVGERGVMLSGGQRQRLCLARALVSRPSLLLLDDATSAVDALTERRILDALRGATGSASVLIVASRLSSILLADRVAVLEEGRIVALGSHGELLHSNRHYRELLAIEGHRGARDV